MTGFLGVSNLGHDPALAESLGNMIVTWAMAESEMKEILRLSLRIDHEQANAVFYGIPNFDGRQKLLRTVVRRSSIPDKAKSDFADAIEQLSQLSRTRNGWVHGMWAIGRANTTVCFMMGKEPNSPARRRNVTANSVQHHIKRVTEITRDLGAARTQMQPE